MKTAASSRLISNDRRRSGYWTSLCFCWSSFNQLLLNVNFKFFSNPIRCGTNILALFCVAHHPNIWIVSVLMLWLLSQYKVSFRLHPHLILIVCLFQEWGSYLVQTLLVLSIPGKAWIPSLNGGRLVWLVTKQSSVFILIDLRLRITHLKLVVWPSTTLSLSDFPRSILLSIRSLDVLLIYHVCF